MIFRRKNRNAYEGWWQPVAGSRSPRLHGKVEWEPSPQGGTEIDLLVKALDLPDGQEVDLVAAGSVLLRAAVTSGSVRKTIRSADGHAVPDLAGSTVELRHGDEVLARTVLEPD